MLLSQVLGASVQAVATVLRLSQGRAGDCITRLGGEEFAVLRPETDAAGAQAIGNLIVDISYNGPFHRLTRPWAST